MPELVVATFEGTVLVRADLSRRDKVSIGRSPTCDLVLSAPSVSRHHALLVEEAGQWLVIDTASSSGVFVGRERVHVAVLDGERPVVIGPAYLWISDLPAAPPPLPDPSSLAATPPRAMLRAEYLEACWRQGAFPTPALESV